VYLVSWCLQTFVTVDWCLQIYKKKICSFLPKGFPRKILSFSCYTYMIVSLWFMNVKKKR
jgi:hypothetical protein